MSTACAVSDISVKTNPNGDTWRNANACSRTLWFLHYLRTSLCTHFTKLLLTLSGVAVQLLSVLLLRWCFFYHDSVLWCSHSRCSILFLFTWCCTYLFVCVCTVSSHDAFMSTACAVSVISVKTNPNGDTWRNANACRTLWFLHNLRTSLCTHFTMLEI